MTGRDLRAAVAAGVLASEREHRELLRSIVDVARAIFGAAASSIFLLDEENDELVFEAVSGHGADTLVGERFSSSKGIAGWVLVTRQPLVVEDVAEDPRFAADVAHATGYVPKGLMAAPLLSDDRALGVLQVLDRQARFTLAEIDLLGLFANQAAIALELLQRARHARAVLEEAGADPGTLALVAQAVEEAPPERRPAAHALLAALAQLLRSD